MKKLIKKPSTDQLKVCIFVAYRGIEPLLQE